VPYASSAAKARSRSSNPERPSSAGTSRFEYARSSITRRIASSATARAGALARELIPAARHRRTARPAPMPTPPCASGRPGRPPPPGPRALRPRGDTPSRQHPAHAAAQHPAVVRETRAQGSGIVLGPDLLLELIEDRPRVEAFVHPHDGHPGHVVAREERVLDRSGTSP